MRMIFAIVLAVAFGSSAQAADPPSRQVRPPVQVVQPICDAKCEAYKRTHGHGLVRSRTELVCIPLKQAKVGIVVIRFYDAAGNELDAGNKQHSNVKNQIDRFCVGRHYLENALAGRAELCNDVKTKILTPEHINILLKSGMPPNSWVYLFASR